MNVKSLLKNPTAIRNQRKSRSGQVIGFEKVCGLVGVDIGDIARVHGVSKRAVRFDEQMPPEIEEQMEVISKIHNLVFQFFANEVSTRLWFRTPNPTLGLVSPREMIRAGRHKKLLKFITSALED